MKKKADQAPPRLARWLIRHLGNFQEDYVAAGDIEEVFHEMVRSRGSLRASCWFWYHTVALLLYYSVVSIKWRMIMFENYFKLAFRNIFNFKGYSLLNISGLAIGMACCVLILLFVMDELSYDRFHPQAERIFRVAFSTSEDGKATNANGSFGVGPLLKKDFPQVVESVRLRRMGQGVKRYVGYKEKKFYEQKFFFAEPSLFTVFHFPLIKGNPDTALNRPNTIVLTEKMAKKYFGDENPIGKTLETDPYNTGEMMLFRITGVAANVPNNSHFHFDFLASYVSQKDNTDNLSGFWNNYTYLLLDNKSAADSLKPHLLSFLHNHWRKNPWYTLCLQPLLDIRLHSRLRSEIEATGRLFYIYIFTAIAIFVLTIACINFMNLTTARSVKRAKEVSLRKVVGAQKQHLIYQFLGESLLLSFISAVVALFLVYITLPLLNSLADKSMTLLVLPISTIFLGMISITLLVGLISGLYPAFFLSTFRPINALKSDSGPSSAGVRLRKGLVTFQFTLSIVIILATLIASNQLRHIQSRNPGYDMEQIMVIPLNKDVRQTFQAVRNEWLKNPAIQNAATSSFVPTRGSGHLAIRYEGQPEGDNALTWVIYGIDREFVNTFGLKILAGEDIHRPLSLTGASDFLVSNLAMREMGEVSPSATVDKGITFINKYKGQVAGVVKDINIYSFHRQPYPIIYMITPIERHNYISVRLSPQKLPETLGYIRNTWQRLVPNYPLDYFFLDQNFQNMHRSDKKFRDLISVFSLLAIFVACMGLVGLAAYLAEQKTREIGIRKVLGASTSGIYLRMSWEFIKWVILANILAWPIGYYVMNKWLQNFVYRIHIGPGVFVLSAALAFVIALTAISYQSLRAAHANPADTFRYE